MCFDSTDKYVKLLKISRVCRIIVETALRMVSDEIKGAVSEEKYERLVVKYNELYRRHRDLEQSHAKCERYMVAAYEKYKTAKDAVREWQDYVDKLRGRQPRSNRHTTHEDPRPQEKRNHERISSSQTTEAEEGSSERIDCEPESESDEPEVVATRQLKRKRRGSIKAMPPPVRIKQEHVSRELPIDLALEDFSSPELKRKKSMRTETSDLDALGERIKTPRKRNSLRAMSEEATRPALLLPTASSLSEGNIPEDVGSRMQVKAEPEVEASHVDPAVTVYDFAIHPSSSVARKGVLHPISVNVPTNAPRQSTLLSGAGRRRRQGPQKDVAFLSESGEEQTSQVVGQPRERTPKGALVSRLDHLLDKPSPDRQALPKRWTPQASSKRRTEARAPPGEQKVDFSNNLPYSQQVPFKLPRGLEQPPPAMLPEDEPLRSRHPESLHLDDFKINPRYLGSDYAFADTFRGREQRRCLVGCTKPECCGDAFRKAVELGAIKSNKTDAQVLEEYLGPNWDTMMGAYDPEKRKDLLVQARAYTYANQHGKHKQAFERRSTPPGFWRTDMPTTQEEQQDRARAHEMERQKVEERWREAMREGGRWLFRDE